MLKVVGNQSDHKLKKKNAQWAFFCWFKCTNIFKYFIYIKYKWIGTQPAITCSKLTKETLDQGVKYVQS